MKQGLHEIGTVKKYPIGMQYKTDNQLYRYGFAAAALAGIDRLVINSNFAPGVTGHENEDGFEGDLYADAPIGQMYVDIADTAGRAENWYQGGHLIIFSTTIWHQHFIVKSEAGDGDKVRCWLSKPIAVEDAEVGDGVTAYRSPYSACMPASGAQANFESFVGLPLRPVTISNFFWLLTAGPVYVCGGAVLPGSAAYYRDCYADPNDGTIRPDLIAAGKAFQRVGHLLSVTGGTAGTYGDSLMMLQLDQ